jgi:hypothetical protein
MRLRLRVLPNRLAICRLDAGDPIPSWPRGTFTSITRTGEELSVVCDEDAVPEDVRASRGWRLLSVEGPIPFEMTGVAAALISPLAAAGVSVFLLATFDTDYLLLQAGVFEEALSLLRDAGHEIG